MLVFRGVLFQILAKTFRGLPCCQGLNPWIRQFPHLTDPQQIL